MQTSAKKKKKTLNILFFSMFQWAIMYIKVKYDKHRFNQRYMMKDLLQHQHL